MNLKKGECKVLHLECQNSMQEYRLWANWLKGSQVQKGPEGVVDKLSTSQHYNFAEKPAASRPVWGRAYPAGWEGILPCILLHWGTESAWSRSGLSSTEEKLKSQIYGHALWAQGAEHRTEEERLRQLGFFSREKGKLRKILLLSASL